VRWHKLAGAGLTVAAAAAAGSLIAGGVGSAASTAPQQNARRTTHGTAPPAVSRSIVKATAAATPATVSSVNRIYLRIPGGASGEVVDGPFTNALNVASWSWGMSSPNRTAPQVSDLNVMFQFDRSVPQLETKAEHATPLTLQLVELSSTNAKVREIDLTGATVDSIQASDSSGSGVPYVSVSFAYTKEQTTYWYNNSSGGTTEYKSCWDVTNQVDCGSAG
jgi:type VI protein secretion system component Hcp